MNPYEPFNLDFAQVANFYIDSMWGKTGTPTRNMLESHLIAIKGVDIDSKEYTQLSNEFLKLLREKRNPII